MKKAITLLLAVVSTLLANFSLAASPSAHAEESRAAVVSRLMQDWQSLMLASGSTIDDARSWARRNRLKINSLNAERLSLAQGASSTDELDLVLLDAPIGAGSQLDVLMANRPGDISMMGTRNVAKSSPATSPGAYAGLVFTATTTCRILDTRPSQGGFGAWAAGSSNLVKIGPYSTAGGGYATGPGAQGGSATSCGLDALAGPGQIAVIMAAVSTVSQMGAGYLTFYPQGAPNPGTASVSQWFQPGYVQTSFVLIPSDLVTTVAASAFTSAATDVIIDVVGYFAAETNDGVTSITAGTGLTGGTITTSGTIGLAATQLLPSVVCTTNQIPKWNGSGWACAADNDTNSGGTVTAVTASAPLFSSGGNTPNISLDGGAVGQVLAGTAGAPSWTDSPSLSGNLTLSASTATAGNILKGTKLFIHNFGLANTFVGEDAGNQINVNGGYNTAVGISALRSTIGSVNTAIGAEALYQNTNGSQNTAGGYDALYSNTIGSGNSAFGLQALAGNIAGDFNSAVGRSALGSNTYGSYNTASGMQSLALSYTGNNNTADGVRALYSNDTGSNNTAVGVDALHGNISGSNNIALGYNAGAQWTVGSYNISIGNPGVAAEAGTIHIGDSNQTRAFIAGIRGVTTGSADAIAVVIDRNGQLGTVISSRRFKDDIADMDTASHALMKLRPVTFHYKTDQNPSGRTLQYGLIAEEVAEVYPGLVAHSADGQMETVMYQFLAPMLLNEVQKQQRMIDAQTREGILQRARLAELTQDCQLQTAAIATQTERIAELERERQILKAALAEIAELKQQTAHLAKLLYQQRTGAVTAGLGLK